MISKRARNIILEILKNGFVRTTDLSTMFKVTDRTIRNDLEEIDYFLKGNGCNCLLRDNKNGIQLQKSDISTKLVYKLINQKDIVTASYTKKERVLEILFALANNASAIKIETLAEALLVSKSTVVKDLEKLKEELMEESFQIHGSLDGIELVGDEMAIRSWVVKQFVQEMDKQTVLDIITLIHGENKITTYKVYWRLYENIELKPILHFVEMLKSYLSVQLSDRLYLQLIGNFCIMLKRIKIGKLIEQDSIYKSSLSKFMVEHLFEIMNREFSLPSNEKTYINYLIHMTSTELFAYEHQEIIPLMENNIKKLLKKMSIYMEFHNMEILYEDIKKEVVMMYVEDALSICESKNVVELHDKVFEDVFTKVKEEIDWLAFHHHKVLDDDYWRIAWHFIAHRKLVQKRKNVLIVSDKATSLNTILIRKLKTIFDIEIAGVCSHAQFDKYISCYTIDCIISTMNVKSEKEVVRVHPLLSEKDIQSLKTHLNTHSKNNLMEIQESFVSNVIESDQVDLQEIFIEIDEELQMHHIVNMNIAKELYTNYENLQRDYMIQEDILYLNIRNHEIVNQNMVLHVLLRNGVMIDTHNIRKIQVFACKSCSAYIEYIESNIK